MVIDDDDVCAEMAAYDRLPPEIRLVLANADNPFHARGVLYALEHGMAVEEIIRRLRADDRSSHYSVPV